MPTDPPLPEWMHPEQPVVRVRSKYADEPGWLLCPPTRIGEKDFVACVVFDSLGPSLVIAAGTIVIPHPKNHQPWVDDILNAGGTVDE